MSWQHGRDMMIGMGQYARAGLDHGMSRSEVLQRTGEAALSNGAMKEEAEHGPSIAVAWAECGFPLVEPSHRLSASLISTSLPSEYINEHVRMPWRCTAFLVPAGVVNEEPVFSVALRSTQDLVWMLSWGRGIFTIGYEKQLASWCGDKGWHRAGDEQLGRLTQSEAEDKERCWRETQVVGRLLVGVCAEMSSHRVSSTASERSVSVKRDRDGFPRAHVFKLTRSVRVDARAAVSEYVSMGASRSPLIQTMVRGHWKAQPCGAGRAQRKLIHVEPYWRGPEDAPIAVRSHTLDQSIRTPPSSALPGDSK